MARIKIHIDTQAATEITIDGIAGPSCLDLVKPLQEHLGKTDRETLTLDFYAEQEGADHEKTHTY